MEGCDRLSRPAPRRRPRGGVRGWSLTLLAAAAALPPSAAAAPPLVLPARQAGEPASWVVTARAVPAARGLARRFDARPLGSDGRFLVSRARATALAGALRRRGLLRWAEPDRRLHAPARAALPATGVAWRDRLGLALVPRLPVAADSPVLALLDTPVDLTHPAFAGSLVTTANPLVPYDLHGTATAAVAAGTGAGGVFGVWPGMRVVNHAFESDGLTCAQSAYLIDRAVEQRAATINMSYGSDDPCFTELASIQHATQRGVVVVAAAGNERTLGNPREYPGAFPHVLTAAALGAGDSAAPFSSAGDAVDLSAPGSDVLTAVPPAFDPDGVPDGVALLSGTSFAAPMVAAAATELRAARPGLTNGQVTAILCDSARDIAPPGWDRRTGCGVPDLAAALRRPAPELDPLEPNDDVVWVDGIGLGRAAPLVWVGGRERVLRATVTVQDDPVDVYRVRLPRHSGLRVTLSPRSRGADLRVLDRGALDIADRSSLLASSRRPGRLADRATIANRSGGARVAFVAVVHDPRAARRQTPYRLSLRRWP